MFPNRDQWRAILAIGDYLANRPVLSNRLMSWPVCVLAKTWWALKMKAPAQLHCNLICSFVQLKIRNSKQLTPSTHDTLMRTGLQPQKHSCCRRLHTVSVQTWTSLCSNKCRGTFSTTAASSKTACDTFESFVEAMLSIKSDFQSGY